MLPGINISFTNGNIGNVVSTDDGVFGLLSSAVVVGTSFLLNTPYVIKGMGDVANLGILPDVNNYDLHKTLEEFYAEAEEGTTLWIIGFDKSTKVSDWFTPVAGVAPVEVLLDKANGEISGLFTTFSPDGTYTLTIEDGIDEDVPVAKAAAQSLLENYTQKKYAPAFVILEAYGFNGVHTDLGSQLVGDNNRVAVFLGETKQRTDTVIHNGCATQVLAGRLAKVRVQENPGRVKRGALETLTAYILDTPVEEYDVEALHDKGYICFRTHVRKSGYYITDDSLATDPSEDYNGIARRRVIDKAFRLAHNIVSDEILEDFTLTNQGKIDPFYAASVEGNIQREIAQQMTANGELSSNPTDKDDLGVEARFNRDLNVSSTNKLELNLKVKPKGYARFFNIALGYDVTLNSN